MIHQIVVRIAEDASVRMFFENDLVPLDKDFESILRFDVKGLADLHGDHDSSQSVNWPCDAGGFHKVTLLRVKFSGGDGKRSAPTIVYNYYTILNL